MIERRLLDNIIDNVARTVTRVCRRYLETSTRFHCCMLVISSTALSGMPCFLNCSLTLQFVRETFAQEKRVKRKREKTKEKNKLILAILCS